MVVWQTIHTAYSLESICVKMDMVYSASRILKKKKQEHRYNPFGHAEKPNEISVHYIPWILEKKMRDK
jgi:hypothetical protein